MLLHRFFPKRKFEKKRKLLFFREINVVQEFSMLLGEEERLQLIMQTFYALKDLGLNHVQVNCD